MNLERISKTEAFLMRRVYLRQEKRIKSKLIKAVKKGNDTTYLKKVLGSIQVDIKYLDNYYKGFSQKKLGLLFKTSYKDTEKSIRAIEAKFGADSFATGVNTQAIKVLSENTYRGLSGVSIAIGRQAEDFLREIGLKQSQGIIFGTDTWQQVAKQMTTELKANNYFTVQYNLKDGGVRNVPARAYSEMVARTTAAQAQRVAAHEAITERGYDLVDVDGVSSFPNSPCIPFEGTTLSLTGETSGYVTYDEALSQGFNHPNCIHVTVFSDKNFEDRDYTITE